MFNRFSLKTIITEHVCNFGFIVSFIFPVEQFLHLSPYSLWDLINVLRLDQGLQIILQDFGEVVLQLGATEVAEDLLPVRRVLEATQIGLQFARKDLEGCRFSDTVGADQSEHLSRPGNRQPVQLEAVLRIPVGGVLFQVARQIDDVDCLERAFLQKKKSFLINLLSTNEICLENLLGLVSKSVLCLILAC
jgi:hypothetical protein